MESIEGIETANKEQERCKLNKEKKEKDESFTIPIGNKRYKDLQLVQEMMKRGVEYFGLMHASITNTDLRGFLSLTDMGEVLDTIENGGDVTRCAS